jgi:hypothetical protein
MSAFGGKAEIGLTLHNVRFWPKADIAGDQLGPLPAQCFYRSSIALVHDVNFPVP